MSHSYIIEKKRVVVKGEKKDWQSIMRQVGGRHYTNLKGNGPAWTFAKDHLEKFLALSQSSSQPSSEHDDDDVSEQQSDNVPSDVEQRSSSEEDHVSEQKCSSEQDDVVSQDMEEEEKIEVSSVSTQTDTHPTYLYDVDEQTQQFILQWLLSAGIATSV